MRARSSARRGGGGRGGRSPPQQQPGERGRVCEEEACPVDHGADAPLLGAHEESGGKKKRTRDGRRQHGSRAVSPGGDDVHGRGSANNEGRV